MHALRDVHVLCDRGGSGDMIYIFSIAVVSWQHCTREVIDAKPSTNLGLLIFFDRIHKHIMLANSFDAGV